MGLATRRGGCPGKPTEPTFWRTADEETTLGRGAAGAGSGDGSGLKLRDVLQGFFDFLETRCVEEGRNGYLQAISSTQTGAISGQDVRNAFGEDERQDDALERLLLSRIGLNPATEDRVKTSQCSFSFRTRSVLATQGNSP